MILTSALSLTGKQRPCYENGNAAGDFDTHNIAYYNAAQRTASATEDRGVIQSFFDRGTADIFNRSRSKDARRTCPEQVWPVAWRKLDQLNAAVSIVSLRFPPGNRLEVLKGIRMGQNSIRINDQYRVCFNWAAEGPERGEITDYH